MSEDRTSETRTEEGVSSDYQFAGDLVHVEIVEPEELRAQIRTQVALNELQIEQLEHLATVQTLNRWSLWILISAVSFVGFLGMAAGVFHVMRADTVVPDYQTAYAYSLGIVLAVLFVLVLIFYVVYRGILLVQLKAREINKLLEEQKQALAEAAPFVRTGYDDGR
jgi:hypothetical protein